MISVERNSFKPVVDIESGFSAAFEARGEMGEKLAYEWAMQVCTGSTELESMVKVMELSCDSINNGKRQFTHSLVAIRDYIDERPVTTKAFWPIDKLDKSRIILQKTKKRFQAVKKKRLLDGDTESFGDLFLNQLREVQALAEKAQQPSVVILKRPRSQEQWFEIGGSLLYNPIFEIVRKHDEEIAHGSPTFVGSIKLVLEGLRSHTDLVYEQSQCFKTDLTEFDLVQRNAGDISLAKLIDSVPARSSTEVEMRWHLQMLEFMLNFNRGDFYNSHLTKLLAFAPVWDLKIDVDKVSDSDLLKFSEQIIKFQLMIAHFLFYPGVSEYLNESDIDFFEDHTTIEQYTQFDDALMKLVQTSDARTIFYMASALDQVCGNGLGCLLSVGISGNDLVARYPLFAAAMINDWNQPLGDHAMMQLMADAKAHIIENLHSRGFGKSESGKLLFESLTAAFSEDYREGHTRKYFGELEKRVGSDFMEKLKLNQKQLLMIIADVLAGREGIFSRWEAPAELYSEIVGSAAKEGQGAVEVEFDKKGLAYRIGFEKIRVIFDGWDPGLVRFLLDLRDADFSVGGSVDLHEKSLKLSLNENEQTTPIATLIKLIAVGAINDLLTRTVKYVDNSQNGDDESHPEPDPMAHGSSDTLPRVRYRESPDNVIQRLLQPITVKELAEEVAEVTGNKVPKFISPHTKFIPYGLLFYEGLQRWKQEQNPERKQALYKALRKTRQSLGHPSKEKIGNLPDSYVLVEVEDPFDSTNRNRTLETWVKGFWSPRLTEGNVKDINVANIYKRYGGGKGSLLHFADVVIGDMADLIRY
jgi:hypothetical protein